MYFILSNIYSSVIRLLIIVEIAYILEDHPSIFINYY